MSTVNAFVAMSTQWRVGANGPVGLDYGALPVVMRLVGISDDDQGEVFDGIRVMENVALAQLRQRNK